MVKKPNKVMTINCEFFAWIIRQRNGVYYSDCRKGKFKLGRHSLGTKDWDEARRNLVTLDRKMAIEKGLLIEPVSVPTAINNHVSISTGWNTYFGKLAGPEVSGGAGPETPRRYRSVLAKHTRFCEIKGVTGWEGVSAQHLREYATALLDLKKNGLQFGRSKKNKLAPRTIYLELTTIKSVLKFLIVEKCLPETCRVHFPLMRPQGSGTYCYTLDEIQAMVDHCNTKPDLEWLAPIVHTLAYTGLRIEEVVGIRQSDLKRDDRGIPRMIHLTDERSNASRAALGGKARRTKARKDRMIPIDSALGDVLNSLPRHENGRLFCGPSRRALTQKFVRENFKKFVIAPLTDRFPSTEGQIGFQHGRMHRFRHFFVSRAFFCGASEGDVREWVGHGSSRIVEMYRHLRPQESVLKLESLDLLNVRANADGLHSQKVVS